MSALASPLKREIVSFRACVRACGRGEAKLRGREENDSQRWGLGWREFPRSGAFALRRWVIVFCRGSDDLPSEPRRKPGVGMGCPS